ncbi:MAG: efflux RND transporter periplasmic adaptor subunit [Candidatus Manganitrophaceae bacterium]|nr:MAG: efflux RND transporter periplasmic adaptor subunit [Candidatus Manganitrophaceae bacterium]
MNSKKIMAVATVLLVGIVLALTILRTEKTSTVNESHEEEKERAGEKAVKGPHGGGLLSDGDFQIELTIYERGVPPQFRAYPFEKGKPIDPGEVRLTVALHRLGGRVDEIRFQKEGDYLRGDQTVEEPHSFDVKVVSERKGKSSQWQYSQVEGRVEMAPEAVKAAGIEIETAGPVRMKTILDLPGEIVLNKNKVAHVVPRLSGVVTEVRKNLSDKVKKGEVLAVLESRELADLKSNYLASAQQAELSRATFKREKQLFEKKISPEQEFLAAKQALAQAEIGFKAATEKLLALGLSRNDLDNVSKGEGLARYELRAPLNGVVIEKRITVGEAIKEDADIFVIADLSTVWGDITVYAKDLRAVRLGQTVTVRSKELGEEATGKISFIGPLVGERSRAASAHVDIPNPKGLWRPGLFVTVELAQEEVPTAVAISAEAIQTFRDWNVVFVQYGDQFEARPLELGRSDGKWVEVVSGLSPGEKYAAKNSFVLKADLGKSGASHDH